MAGSQHTSVSVLHEQGINVHKAVSLCFMLQQSHSRLSSSVIGDIFIFNSCCCVASAKALSPFVYVSIFISQSPLHSPPPFARTICCFFIYSQRSAPHRDMAPKRMTRWRAQEEDDRLEGDGGKENSYAASLAVWVIVFLGSLYGGCVYCRFFLCEFSKRPTRMREHFFRLLLLFSLFFYSTWMGPRGGMRSEFDDLT